MIVDKFFLFGPFVISFIVDLLRYFGFEIYNFQVYFNLICLIIIIFRVINKDLLFFVGLFIYMSCYIFFWNPFDSVSSKSSYMFSFVSVFATIRLLNLKAFVWRPTENSLMFFFLFVICIYVFSSLYFDDRVDIVDDERGYLYGFLWPHHMSYLVSIFFYWCLKRGLYFLGFVLILFSFVLGARSGLLVTLLGLVMAMPRIFRRLSMMKKGIAVFLLGTLLGVLFVLAKLDIGPVAYYAKSFSDIASVTDLDSKESSKITAFRSVLMLNFIEYVGTLTVGQDLFFGLGPLSSLGFNYNSLGVRIWMHNDFLDIFFSYGLIGLVAYVFVIVKFFLQNKMYFPIAFILITALTNGFVTYTPFVLIFLLYNVNILSENRSIFKSLQVSDR